MMAWYLVIAAALLSNIVSGAIRCDPSWTLNPRQNVCLKVFKQRTLTFIEARETCKREGGDLYTAIRSEDHLRRLSHMLGSSPTWLGGEDLNNDGRFKLIDGTPVGVVQPGEDVRLKGKCLAINQGTLVQSQCEGAFDFLCQKTSKNEASSDNDNDNEKITDKPNDKSNDEKTSKKKNKKKNKKKKNRKKTRNNG